MRKLSIKFAYDKGYTYESLKENLQHLCTKWNLLGNTDIRIGGLFCTFEIDLVSRHPRGFSGAAIGSIIDYMAAQNGYIEAVHVQ